LRVEVCNRSTRWMRRVSKYAIIPPRFAACPQVEDTFRETLQAAIYGRITVREESGSLELGITEIVTASG